MLKRQIKHKRHGRCPRVVFWIVAREGLTQWVTVASRPKGNKRISREGDSKGPLHAWQVQGLLKKPGWLEPAVGRASSCRRQGKGVAVGPDGPEPMCCPPLSAGHSAPDEVPGGGTVLHEHQLGAGELQQVCSRCLPCSAHHVHLSPPCPSFLASASIPRGRCPQLLLNAHSQGQGAHYLTLG